MGSGNGILETRFISCIDVRHFKSRQMPQLTSIGKGAASFWLGEKLRNGAILNSFKAELRLG
jgi:hypothetical protein